MRLEERGKVGVDLMEENNKGEGFFGRFHEFQGYNNNHHEEMLPVLHHQGGEGFMFPPEAAASSPSSSMLPWSFPPLHSFNSVQFSASNPVRDQDCFFSPLPPLPPPPTPTLYGDFYTRRASAALQFAYDGGGVGPSSDPLGLGGLYMGSEALVRGGGVSCSSPFAGLQSEFSQMSTQEIMDAKALAASKSHSEAERRRRERINAHLAKLRSLLPSTTKTDKASLLAEVIQHVKELKRQTSEIAEESPLPTEVDELTVDAANDEDGKFVIKASLSCEDRSDLLPDLIKALKSLRLRTLKAEITTLGGRVKNVLVITGEDNPEQQSITSIQDALKAVMDRTAADEPSSTGSIKRQRTTNLSSILEHRSI